MKIDIHINGKSYSFDYFGKHPKLARKALEQKIKQELKQIDELLLLTRLRKEAIGRLSPYDDDDSYIPRVLT